MAAAAESIPCLRRDWYVFFTHSDGHWVISNILKAMWFHITVGNMSCIMCTPYFSHKFVRIKCALYTSDYARHNIESNDTSLRQFDDKIVWGLCVTPPPLRDFTSYLNIFSSSSLLNKMLKYPSSFLFMFDKLTLGFINCKSVNNHLIEWTLCFKLMQFLPSDLILLCNTNLIDHVSLRKNLTNSDIDFLMDWCQTSTKINSFLVILYVIAW